MQPTDYSHQIPTYRHETCRRCKGTGEYRGHGICYGCHGTGVAEIQDGFRERNAAEQAVQDEYQAGVDARAAREAARQARREAR